MLIVYDFLAYEHSPPRIADNHFSFSKILLVLDSYFSEVIKVAFQHTASINRFIPFVIKTVQGGICITVNTDDFIISISNIPFYDICDSYYHLVYNICDT